MGYGSSTEPVSASYCRERTLQPALSLGRQLLYAAIVVRERLLQRALSLGRNPRRMSIVSQQFVLPSFLPTKVGAPSEGYSIAKGLASSILCSIFGKHAKVILRPLLRQVLL